MPIIATIAASDEGVFYALSMENGGVPSCTCNGWKARGWCRHVEWLGVESWKKDQQTSLLDPPTPSQPVDHPCIRCGMETGNDIYASCHQCEWYLHGGEGMVPDPIMLDSIERPEVVTGICLLCERNDLLYDGKCLNAGKCSEHVRTVRNLTNELAEA